MRSLATGEPVGLRVAAPPTTAADILSPFVAESGADGVLVDIREESPRQAYDVLDRGEVDFVVSTIPPPGHLESRVVCEAPIFAMTAADHPLADRTTVHLTELLLEQIIVMDRGHATRRLFDDAVVKAGLGYSPAYETRSTDLAQALAAAGRGIAVLSDDPRFGLHPVSILASDDPLAVTLYAAWDAAHYARGDIARTVLAISRFYPRHYAVGQL